VRTIQDDLLSTLLGIAGGNVLGVVRGLGSALAGAISGDGSEALGGLGSAAQAILPRYGFFSGPDYGGDFEGLSPRTIIDEATFRHDQAYRRLQQQGVPFFSPQRNAADLTLIRDVWRSHRLGPVGQIYRAGLTAAFGLKVGVQSLLGRLGSP